MNTLANFKASIREAEAVFMKTAQGSLTQKKAYVSTLKNQKRATTALLIIKVAQDNPTMFNRWRGVVARQFQTIYDDFLVPMSQTVFKHHGLTAEDYPKRQNFLSLNNLMTKIRKDSYRDGSEPLVTATSPFVFHDLIFTSEYIILQEFFWTLKTQGYYRDFKNNAHAKEQESVLKERSKRHCVPDGGIDGYIMYGHKRIPFDHKEMIVTLENVASLVSHATVHDRHYAIKCLGSAGVLTSCGMLSKQFIALCHKYAVTCSVMIDGEYQLLIFQPHARI